VKRERETVIGRTENLFFDLDPHYLDIIHNTTSKTCNPNEPFFLYDWELSRSIGASFSWLNLALSYSIQHNLPFLVEKTGRYDFHHFVRPISNCHFENKTEFMASPHAVRWSQVAKQANPQGRAKKAPLETSDCRTALWFPEMEAFGCNASLFYCNWQACGSEGLKNQKKE
jgi:hypothetical protein